jgi:hypothetical protein
MRIEAKTSLILKGMPKLSESALINSIIGLYNQKADRPSSPTPQEDQRSAFDFKPCANQQHLKNTQDTYFINKPNHLLLGAGTPIVYKR